MPDVQQETQTDRCCREQDGGDKPVDHRAQALRRVRQLSEVHGHFEFGLLESAKKAIDPARKSDCLARTVLEHAGHLREPRLGVIALHEQAAHVRFCDKKWLKRGIQPLSDSLMHRERFDEKAQFGGKRQTPAAHQAREVGDNFAEAILTERKPVVSFGEMLEFAAQCWSISLVPDDPESPQAIDERIEVVTDEGQQRIGEFGAHEGIDSTDHSEVVDDEPTVGENGEIARMRVGVKEAMNEDTVEDETSRLQRECVAIDASAVEFLDAIDRDTIDSAQRENRLGGAVPKDAGNDDIWPINEKGPEAIGVASFSPVVEFAAYGPGELVEETNEIVVAGGWIVPTGEIGDLAEQR